MRRPNMLKYNDQIDECARHLQSLSSARLSDKCLLVWVRLSRITEEITTALSFDDLGKGAEIASPQTQKVFRSLEERLMEWRSSLAPEILNGLQKVAPQASHQTC